MATDFPGSIDSFTNPTASPPGTDKLSTPAVKHSTMHTDENDAIVAIETWLGASNSVSSGTITGRLTNLEAVVSGSSSGGAPTSGTYLTLSALSGTAARVWTPGTGLSGTDAGSGSTYTVRVHPTGVSSGTYYNPTALTVNAQGQITFAASPGASDSTGFVQGVPLMSRTQSSLSFAGYVSETDRVYFTTAMNTGSMYYIDRTMDYPVLLATFSGRNPSTWIYSTIITGFLIANGSNAAFTCTVTGGILVTGVTLGMQGGCAIRNSVSGKTIYTTSRGNSQVEVYDPATNTNVTQIDTVSFPGADGRSLVWVSGVDMVYNQQTNSDISKVECSTNTLLTTISGVGLNLSSTASIAYNLAANRIFGCGTSSPGGNKIWYFTPTTGTETISTLDFPTGFQGTNGAEACISFGNYVYFSTDTSSPSVVLVLDAVNLVWKRPLGVTDSTSATMAKGSFMAGVLSEGVLYLGNSVSGFYTYGRV